jgi:glycosyltransferase involved in cell wall biosynthesis
MPSVTVSIALATFNGERFLEAFLESVCDQTRAPDRIVVVDDASTDGTLEILEYFATQLPLEIYRRASNGGHRVAFSEALERTREDFVVFADQDDVWEANKIATLLMNIGDADLVHSDARVIDEEGQLIHESWHGFMGHPVLHSTEKYLLGWNNVTGCTAMLRGSLRTKVLPIPAGVPVHDWWLALYASLGRGIRYVDMPLIRYRLHGGNAVGAGKVLSLSETLRQQMAWFGALGENRERLGLTVAQALLVDRLERVSRQRLVRKILPEWFPWVWENRTLLFAPNATPLQQCGRAVMTVLGLPLLRWIGKK